MEMTEQLLLTSKLTISQLTKKFGNKLEFNKDLSQFSSYRTGGQAACFMMADSSELLSKTVQTANELKIPYFLIGGGTNILISDLGYTGLIIKVDVKKMSLIADTEIECGAGEELMDLVNFATSKSLTGIEFASGIVGTVGGAIYGNAGAYGGDVGTVLEEFVIVDRAGQIKTVASEYGGFSYRDSKLKVTGDIVVSGKFKLQIGDPIQIQKKVDEIMAIREAKLPYDDFSAGCYFKNIPDPKEKYGKLAAGKLLEEVGAKDISLGGAAVSEKHANIIINKNNATSKDIKELADILRVKVNEKFNVELEEEVIHIGEF